MISLVEAMERDEVGVYSYFLFVKILIKIKINRFKPKSSLFYYVK